MNRNVIEEFKPKCKFTVETLLTIISVLIMWGCYYFDNNVVNGDNLAWTLFWGFVIIVGMNVCFPAWWIVIKNHEGFEGMRISKNNIGLAIMFSIALGLVRVPELIKISTGVPFASIIPVIVFNLLSIWEVCFIFSWLFTRYNKAFGKGIAAVLTAISVGIYHIGSLRPEQILTLIAGIFLCSLCFGVTDNVFTLWPIYWIIGCSASIIRGYGAESFPWEAVMSMGIILVFQLIGLMIILCRSKRSRKNH